MTHFAVGVAGALLVLAVVDLPVRVEVGGIILGGFVAIAPDGHHVVARLGFDGVAAAWRAVHGSRVADVFVLHRAIDATETGNPNLEAALALAALLGATAVYLLANEFRPDRPG